MGYGPIIEAGPAVPRDAAPLDGIMTLRAKGTPLDASKVIDKAQARVAIMFLKAVLEAQANG